jgi:hypothetical protein
MRSRLFDFKKHRARMGSGIASRKSTSKKRTRFGMRDNH